VLTTLQKLDDGRMTDRLMGWIVTVSITAFAFLLRVVNLGRPEKLIFDETYYAKDAYALLKFGYEREWPDSKIANPQVVAGTPDIMTDSPEFMVHPPLGKWLIAVGEHLFGMNSFGWRFMACVFGALLVFLTIRLARRLSRSTLIGGIAGLLLTFDGLAFTMSRIALLDIFQATFAVAAVCCVVADRDWFRHKLADHLRAQGLVDLDGAYGPLLLWRPWRLLAGVMFGLSMACKWNTMYVIAVFGIVSVVWDVQSRRLAGADRRAWWSLLRDAPAAFVYLVVVAIPVYLASWAGWLYTTGGWGRDFGVKNPDHPLVKAIGGPLASLWNYHVKIYEFHTSENTLTWTHPYEANPAGWLVMARPIGLDAQNGINPGEQGCEAVGTTCLRVISGMGTPLLWWLAAAALVAGLWWWLSGKDWRFSVPVLATLSVWLPWFQYTGRPLFFFYAIMIIPFTVTGLAMAFGTILGPADAPDRARRAVIVGSSIALIVFNFAFIYPVLTDELLTRPQWLARMWFGTWI